MWGRFEKLPRPADNEVFLPLFFGHRLGWQDSEEKDLRRCPQQGRDEGVNPLSASAGVASSLGSFDPERGEQTGQACVIALITTTTRYNHTRMLYLRSLSRCHNEIA